MKRYIKPAVKIKKVKINSFLSNNLRSPFQNFNQFFLVQPVFATCPEGYICPPDTGSAGLKDNSYVKLIIGLNSSG